MGCPWAARGNFAMQIRLPTTSIYGKSGQLNGQLTISNSEKSRCVCETLTMPPAATKSKKAIFRAKAKVKVTRSLPWCHLKRHH